MKQWLCGVFVVIGLVEFQVSWSFDGVCPSSCRACFHERNGNGIVVDCKARNLTRIPQGLPRETTKLNLQGNQLTKLEPDLLSGLTRLKKLNLTDNQLSELPSIGHLPSLQVLSIKNNKLKAIPVDALRKVTRLKFLELDGNRISDVPDFAFRNLSNLHSLCLSNNNISRIGENAFAGLRSLKTLRLTGNKLTEIPSKSLRLLTNLSKLCLSNNNISRIGENAFAGLRSLKTLRLTGNKLTEIPSKALRLLTNLNKLYMEENLLTVIRNDALVGLTKLKFFWFKGNAIQKVEYSAFANLPALEQLSLVNLKLTKFPNLTGATSLTKLELQHNRITRLPEGFCNMLPRLEEMDISYNKIRQLPDVTRCKHLEVLKLDHNMISSIGNKLRGLKNLIDLNLSGNKIAVIEDDSFQGLSKLNSLDLASNNINYIGGEAFRDFRAIFAINLNDNSFRTFPSKGLQTLVKLSVTKNKELRKFPSPLELPSIRKIFVHYPYHCCQFRKEKDKPLTTGIEEDILSIDDPAFFKWEMGTDDMRNDNIGTDNYTAVVGAGDEDLDYQDESASGMDNVLLVGLPSKDNTSLGIESSSSDKYLLPVIINTEDEQIECTPQPDPFFPCDELMEFIPLRVGVWLVFLLALLGNAAVIVVIFVSHTKMDVSRFLICNLAFADLCMGVYLGLLAIVDISTKGHFRKVAVEWQLSSGCKSAGFLAVLSSESSVLTLVIITIERYIAIKQALHIHKRISLKKALIMMICVWSFSLVTAILPLANISSYTKFSICLPFETQDSASLAFVTFLLVLNGTAFLVIVTCYVLIYCSIKGSNAWNTNDFRVAKRMAVLVVTDFVCWAPIAFLALTAAFGSTLVSLSTAKFLAVFIFPLNSCANPFLYAFFTKQFKSDCLLICKKVKDNQSLKTSRPFNQRRKFSLSLGLDSRRASAASSNNNSSRLDHSLEGLLNRLREQRRNSVPAAARLCTATLDATITTSLQHSASDTDKSKSANTSSIINKNIKHRASTEDLEQRKHLIAPKETVTKDVLIQKVTSV